MAIDLNNLTEDDINKMSEDELKELDAQLSGGSSADDKGYPKAIDKDSQFKFFREILERKDTSKVGNLDPKTELGFVYLPVRDCQHIAAYAETEKLDIVQDYFMKMGEITLATSLSKDAKFIELIVTQIKRDATKRSIMPRKKGFFGLFNKGAEAEE